MKKSILMLTCSMLALSSIKANALTKDEQMYALKEVFIASFNSMDDNKDGKVDEQEYLRHQFKKIRENIIEENSIDASLDDSDLETPKVSKENKPKDLSGMKDSVNIMQSMVDFSLDEDELDNIEDISITKEDVMPQKLNVITKDDGIDEEYIAPLEALDFENVTEELRVEPKLTKEDEKDKEIQDMISIIKKSLPKEIDEITKWVDIKYQDKMVTYVYKADIDSSTFSDDDMKLLTESIKNDSCMKANESMCPKIKPMFIDEGINLSILYTDKNDKNLSACEFTKDTCL